jgi:hypothetical protein
MKISPRYIGLAIGLITGLVTSTGMTFIALAFNYGFQPDFPLRWLKAAALSYLTIVPVTLFIVPPIQRMVFHMADIDPKTFQPRSPKPAS